MDELSDKELAEMNDDEFNQRLSSVDRKNRKATIERRKDAQHLLQTNAPKTKLVSDEEGRPVEMQANTDTEDPNKVPNTLNGKIPNESGKEEGEKTTQTSYAESVINDIENGGEGSKVGKAQIKEVWGGEVDAKKNENKEVTAKDLPTEKDIKGGKGNDGGGITIEQALDRYKQYLHKGIYRDYKNGLFGDITTKQGRADAKSLATYFVVNRIGTFLANLANGYFGRPIEKSAYRTLLDEQESALTQLGVERYGEAVKRDIARDWGDLSETDKQNIINGSALRNVYNNIDINDTTTAARWLGDTMLSSFVAKVSKVDDANVRKALLENEQLQKVIAQIQANTNLTKAEKDKVEEEIVRLAKENKYIDAEKVLKIAENGASTVNELLGVIASGVKLGGMLK